MEIAFNAQNLPVNSGAQERLVLMRCVRRICEVPYFIGVDVGTGSARAGVFNEAGELLAAQATSFSLYRPRADYVEQSSTEIWSAVAASVREAVSRSQSIRRESKASASTPPARSLRRPPRANLSPSARLAMTTRTSLSGWIIAPSPRPPRSTLADTMSCAMSVLRSRRKWKRRNCSG